MMLLALAHCAQASCQSSADVSWILAGPVLVAVLLSCIVGVALNLRGNR